ncbi:MAG: hypothetical protein AAFR64_10530 [Pseudomonadota bacterium]
MKFAKMAVLATTLTLAPFAANAQDAGTKIYNQDAEPVELGTVVSKTADVVVVDTGTYEVSLPVAPFQEREGKWTINVSLEALNGFGKQQADAAAAAAAKLDAALTVGTAVNSADTQPAGSIIAVDIAADQILVKNGTGLVSLKKEHFAVDASDNLTALYTLEQLASFTTEIPEGAEVRTASGDVVDFYGTGTTASAAAPASTGASE